VYGLPFFPLHIGDRLRDSTPPSSEVAPVKKEPETKSQLAAAAAADPLSPSSSPSKGRSPSSSPSKRRVPIVPGSLPPPEGWKQIYDLVWELRLARDAPVDWAGCEVVGKGSEFHILVALMLSSQTKDQVVSHIIVRARARHIRKMRGARGGAWQCKCLWQCKCSTLPQILKNIIWYCHIFPR